MAQGCHKQFLDAKPTTTLVVPTTLTDFQALLDNTSVFGQVPTLGEASADNYWFPDSTWLGLDTREHNAYIWAPDIFGGQGGQLDWNTPYQQVFYANVVLDGLPNIKYNADSAAQWDALEGTALFFRAFAFYNIAQLFALPYDPTHDSAGLGIPLRLHSDVTTPSVRSSVWQTYQQILNDLDSAEQFLPVTLPGNYRNRPIRLAAQALLSRVYLSMRNYVMARTTADSALKVYSTLIDYNTLPLSRGVPIGLLNSETLYQASFLNPATQGATYFSVLEGGFYANTRIDTGLIDSYDSNDLRRVVYYHYKPPDSSYLKGSYAGNNFPFGGLATDELYLIRAEGAARAGDAASAMSDVNTLLSNRWKTGTFPGYTVGSAQEALDTVLLERRKELSFRGLRWTDLRRLNAEGANITLTRFLFGQTYTLTPNSDLYTLPLPPDVINLSTMKQNPR